MAIKLIEAFRNDMRNLSPTAKSEVTSLPDFNLEMLAWAELD